MNHQEKRKYIPLNVGETAVLHDANTLLPREEIYERLAALIMEARDRADEAKGQPLNKLRAHNAISIDGARGTGKTAVLVNLQRYLALEHNKLLSDIHILEPIDPTLLEDGESLFLHILVAAVLHDDGIKQAQRNNPERSRMLNQALDKLAHSLEAVDTQKERQGMDKVRAMYGNKHLADCVQDFFREAAELIGKKLLILPIDDVDTSLNRAFENLEIIRRYLTTPYVLPIVSGDRGLYNEVTWRDFHSRLTKDSAYRSELAYTKALELADEYQRKILPFPRRLTMPAVSTYWRQGNIYLHDEKHGDIMPLRNFISWMGAFLEGPVNGQEDSRLLLPIPSIRSLTQLVNHCSSFIPLLPDAIRGAKNELEVRRIWQMPTVPLEVLANFQSRHSELNERVKREYGDAYKAFSDRMKEISPVDYSLCKIEHGDGNQDRVTKSDLTKKIAEYFRFEPKAGAVYLVLLAKQHWKIWASSSPLLRQGSIFDTPLFQPLAHNKTELDFFDKTADLSAWPSALEKRLPSEWLAGLKSRQTILPYPVAEVGINAASRWDYKKFISSLTLEDLGEANKNKATFLITLLAQRNFYTNANQTMLLNIGRIFELIIASIIGPVSQEDIQAILNRAPFFSTRALAPTKTLTLEDASGEEQDAIEVESDYPFELIGTLVADINEWRNNHEVDKIELSPWLIYKVFNKVYSQVTRSIKPASGIYLIGPAINIVAHTFYATWSAFGSFEKGELFGLPNVVATTNLNLDRLKNFANNPLFTTNIGPFAPTNAQIINRDETYENRSNYGRNTRTISYCLAEHPLKMWIDKAIYIEWPRPVKDSTAKIESFLRENLRIKTQKLDKGTITTAAKKRTKTQRDKILEQIQLAEFDEDNELVRLFIEISAELDTTGPVKETP